mmetsp:Transcript_11053/g.27178  ORF Transcript_11053/g.27178 Transcript_11053/m.27178 type:complete len:212 (-) Transcript_11053:473-1108(-)
MAHPSASVPLYTAVSVRDLVTCRSLCIPWHVAAPPYSSWGHQADAEMSTAARSLKVTEPSAFHSWNWSKAALSSLSARSRMSDSPAALRASIAAPTGEPMSSDIAYSAGMCTWVTTTWGAAPLKPAAAMSDARASPVPNLQGSRGELGKPRAATTTLITLTCWHRSCGPHVVVSRVPPGLSTRLNSDSAFLCSGMNMSPMQHVTTSKLWSG